MSGFLIFSQRDPRWDKIQLGWGPPGSTLGRYGCDEACDSMIAWDSGFHLSPPQLNATYDAARIYARDPGGDYDLLTDDALARAFPGRFRITKVAGFNAAAIHKALASPDTYVKLWISTISVPTHFVIAYAADGMTIADPWTGRVGSLEGYGGPRAVKKMVFVQRLPAPIQPKPVPPPVPAPAPIPKPPVYSAIREDDGTPIFTDQDGAAVVAMAVTWQESHYAIGVDITKDSAFFYYLPPTSPPDTDDAPVRLPTPPPPYGPADALVAALETILVAVGRFIASERR